MNTLLCAVNSKYIHSCPAVYSLEKYSRVYSAMQGKPVGNIAVKEFFINQPLGPVLYEINNEKPDVFALSVYIWNVEYCVKLCRDVRKMFPEAAIILGGPEVSYGKVGEIFGEDNYDYVIQGEGESAFFELLSKIYNEKEQKATENGKKAQETEIYPQKEQKTAIISKEERYITESDKILQKGKAVWAKNLLSLDEIPFIYDEDNIKRFENRILYYETSRGCPFSCAYCLSGSESKVRFLSLPRVFKEIDFFVAHRISQVKFVDRTFNCNPERAKKIAEYIINLQNCVTNFHFEVGADLFDDAFIRLLESAPAGRIQIEAGIQSVHEETLSACCRKTNMTKCFKNLKKIISFGNINVHTDLIAGLPGESAEQFRQSFNEVYALGSHQMQLGFLKLLKGAPLESQTEDFGYVFSENTPYEIISNNYISKDELYRLREIEDMLERYCNSGKYHESISRILQYFENPYKMYERLADYAKEKNALYAPLSQIQGCELLRAFAKTVVHDENELEEFDFLLLLDYFSTSRSELPPPSLKYAYLPEKHLSQGTLTEKGIYNDATGIKNHKIFAVKSAKKGNTYILFNYDTVNPVTGRYSYKTYY